MQPMAEWDPYQDAGMPSDGPAQPDYDMPGDGMMVDACLPDVREDAPVVSVDEAQGSCKRRRINAKRSDKNILPPAPDEDGVEVAADDHYDRGVIISAVWADMVLSGLKTMELRTKRASCGTVVVIVPGQVALGTVDIVGVEELSHKKSRPPKGGVVLAKWTDR